MTIKTVETENEGLKRAFMLTIPAEDIEARVEQEVKRIAPQVRMPGFRPGKVPPNLIRKMHGEALRGDALQASVQESVQQLLTEQKIRPALQPQVELDEGYAPGKDAEVRVSLEALPEVPKPAIDDLQLDRLTVDADQSAIDDQIKQLASQSKRWDDAPKKHAAANGDLVVIDFEGEVEGTPFEGGKGEDMSVELGSGRLIPGFEEQLIGAKAGDSREVNVTFPDDYQAKNLEGKSATFAVTVKAVKTGGENKVDEDFAKSLGLNDLEQLKGLIRGQLEQELNGLTRTHMKRQLLDQLAARHDFPVPQSMVEAEYQNIIGQLRHEASHEADEQAALAEIEADADEYRKIAERRVRLGLLLSEIGSANGVDVTEQEMQRLVMQAASQYQGKDRETFVRYIQQEPMAAAQLRAPLYEDKVVDFLFARAKITDRKATRAELEADLESEEGHVHGPGCGHDHGHAVKPKAKKARQGQGAGKEHGKGQDRRKARRRGARQGAGREGFGQAQACQAGKGWRGTQGPGSEGASKAVGEKGSGEEASQEGLTSIAIELVREDFDRALELLGAAGFRLDVIYPADDPHTAILSAGKETLRLTRPGASPLPQDLPPFEPEFVLTKAGATPGQGRAGMLYRDLIPGRLGGRYIASHITIPDGGPVADWVHYHRIALQMIFVRRGWVRVVYEGQGEPFVMNEGDLVLQPPQIRHRVLESSGGLEVVEISAPASHGTFADHVMVLPSGHHPGQRFSGQRFLHHVAADTPWTPFKAAEVQETDMFEKTGGLADVSAIRAGAASEIAFRPHDGELVFGFVLDGSASLDGSALGPADAFAVPPDRTWTLTGLSKDFRLLHVTTGRLDAAA